MAVVAEHDFWGTLSAIALTICGVAALAVVVSKNATTVPLVQASGNAFSNALATALSPVTGGGVAMGGMSSFPIG